MINYIGNNYEKILNICKIYSKTNYDDLMGIIIDIFINKDVNVVDDEKFFYLITVIRNQVYNKKSKFNNFYNNNTFDLDYEQKMINIVDDDNYDYNYEIDEKIDSIIKKIKVLKDDLKISKEDQNCFLYYYLPEYKQSIKKLDLKEVKKLRKTSYRDLSKKTSYNYQKIRFCVLKVTNLLKQ